MISNSPIHYNQNPDSSVLKKNIYIFKTQWNSELVNELEQKFTQTLKRVGFNNLHVIQVPGAIELVFSIRNTFRKLEKSKQKPDIFVALGCVIEGDTPHFEYVCQYIVKGICDLNLTLPIPTIFGVLTVNNIQQAKDRVEGTKLMLNKGEEFAYTTINMLDN